MARKQVRKSEQINNQTLEIDYDQPLCGCSEILKVLQAYLGDNCELYEYEARKYLYKYEHDEIKEYLLVGSITYLSFPHAIYKKRFQLKKWYKRFYDEHKNEPDTKIRLIGVYHYDKTVVFVDFNIEDYINKKMNSSAAHVYTNDLFQARKKGMFEKIDSRGNRITTVDSSLFGSFLQNGYVKQDIFSLFDRFNKGFPFGQWILADTSIEEMKTNGWYQWRGGEWPGWLLEYKFFEFINEQRCEAQMAYIGNVKKDKRLDFDLFFKEMGFYGDIKSSDINKHEMPGNDKASVVEAIRKFGKLWIVLFEHDTVKDSQKENAMAKKRMSLLGTPYKPGGKISYATRMKYSIKYKRMRIFELNQINMSSLLSDFRQGRQQSGAKRKPKFMIKKRQIDNYIIYSYEI